MKITQTSITFAPLVQNLQSKMQTIDHRGLSKSGGKGLTV